MVLFHVVSVACFQEIYYSGFRGSMALAFQDVLFEGFISTTELDYETAV